MLEVPVIKAPGDSITTPNAETTPAEIIDTFRSLHDSDEPLYDKSLDTLLGLDIEKTERQLLDALRDSKPAAYRDEDIWLGGGYVWTHYDDIRDDVKALDLHENDIVYDLGSGYGRFPLYVAMTTNAVAKGVEIVAERVVAADAVKQRLGLPNVDFITGNVLDQDISDGTVFYMFNPFSGRTFTQVKDKLKAIAANKQIRLVVAANWRFHHEDWLVQTARLGGLTRIYESVPPKRKSRIVPRLFL